VSFHKYGDFFPGTGALADTGHSGGHNYSVNVPLQEGMDDESYCLVFEPVMQKVRWLSPLRLPARLPPVILALRCSATACQNASRKPRPSSDYRRPCCESITPSTVLG